MKSFSKTLLALYVLCLLWLILFKTSLDLFAVLDHQKSSLNLIPFAHHSGANSREMIDNLIVFIPLGLLLSVNFKRASLWRKLALVGFLSLTAEMLQFALAIGVADITDVLMNIFGGLIGLTLYEVSHRHIHSEKLDRFIVVTSAVLLILCMLLRFMVLKVRY